MSQGKFDSANQKHYPDMGSDASSVWNFCTGFSETSFGGETSGSITIEMSAVSQAMKTYKHLIILKILVKTDFQQAYKNMFS